MRTGARGSPSWPGHSLEAGYVDADCSDGSQKTLADGAGHTFLDRPLSSLPLYRRSPAPVYLVWRAKRIPAMTSTAIQKKPERQHGRWRRAGSAEGEPAACD